MLNPFSIAIEPSSGITVARDQAEDRAFARAVLAHERELHAATHRKIDLSQDPFPPVGERNLIEPQNDVVVRHDDKNCL